MAAGALGYNQEFPIFNPDGTSFNGLVLKKSAVDSVVMSLGDKISGDVYCSSNDLVVTMKEYVVYNGIRYTLVNPPVIVREGLVKDNSELCGKTKYSFTFYHPMYMLGNFPFTDVAVTSGQEKYLSQNRTFSWIGTLVDFEAKLNKNLQGTEWCVEIGETVSQQERTKLSDVLSFDQKSIADALKTGYDTWKVPYIIDVVSDEDERYSAGKRFLVRFGLPSQEILVENELHEQVPFVFRFSQGVGLKNNSRTPRNNKIVTRISGYGSETNIPYGYPQIPWTGNQSWNYTINNDPNEDNSYPIYDGIMNGQRVRLIKHPFTRTTLMPSIYSESVNKKVNPNATGYDPTTEIKDYYDADSTYENPINVTSPSFEAHGFDKIKPELGEAFIVGVGAYDEKWDNAITLSQCLGYIDDFYSESENDAEKTQLGIVRSLIPLSSTGSDAASSDDYTYDWAVTKDDNYTTVSYISSGVNFMYVVRRTSQEPNPEWDDTMDDDGNYVQSYFKLTLPQLSFDIYACAAVTQEMTINMRSGDCLGCSFPVAVDWDDYKRNFYDADGNFAPNGSQRDLEKYPNSASGQISVIVKKDIDTFGTLMPSIYQQPAAGDKFVILGISLPYTYVTEAEVRLDSEMKQYMRDNNVYYYDYPLKFDEYFLLNHQSILAQMKTNVVVRFEYAGTTMALYIKQMTIKYGQSQLPQYDITLTDDVEIVLNQIGKVSEEVSNLRVLFGEGNAGLNLSELDRRYLSKLHDDRASGLIALMRGIQVGEQFVSGLLGEGGIFRIDADGKTYIEADKLYVRMRAYFDTVEVRRYMHSGGNRIASKAGIKCTRVEYIDTNGDVTIDASLAVKYRCYFRANDNGITITNDFVVNDLAYCKETNVDTENVNQHGYWRKVVGVGNTVSESGELYIDISASDCQSGSDIPIAQDDIIQLGNTTDTTRQGAIIEYVGGADAPAYQIYQGINSYSLNNKNYVRFGYDSQSGGAQAYIGNPDGSTYLWYHNVTENGVTFPKLEIKANVAFTSPVTHQETTIEDFATAITNKTEDLQRQIDGEIESWFYAGVPTLLNAPANTWDTTEKKDKHLGDLYYDKNTGYGYRFVYDNDDEVYMWTQIYDDALVEALRLANEAQDTADHKRRVFLTTPTPPYDAGDLWVNAVWPASGASQGATYNNDILKCVTSKIDSQSFAIADWTKASKYTDDSQFETYISQILNGTNEQTDPAVVAQALHVIKGALNQDTNIVGGLMLTTLIGMRDSNGTLWGGMNGQYDANAYGGGLASWYGGGMIDKYNPTTQQFDVQNGANIGFRFNGSGYVAGGAIAWDATGLTNVNVSSITAATINLGAEGVATQKWVGDNYVSIAYFDRLFRAFNGDNLVNHNDTQSTIDNIKAMFGFWTEQYLSALGNSGGGSVSLTLANMGDVSLNNLDDGQVLTYNATTGKWVNANPQGGVTDLASLTDVTLTTPSANQVLLYDGTTSKWINSDLKTINGQPIYGTGNIEVGGGASGNYLPLSGGTLTGPLELARGVDIRSDDYILLVYRPSNQQTISSTQWGVGATNIQGVIRSSASDLLHWRGGTSGQAYAILDEYNATTILNDSYLPLTGGTLSGRLTINAGVLNVTGENNDYTQGIRLHPVNGTSSIFFGCDADSGMTAGMFGITHNTTGLRIRGQASTTSRSLVDYLTVAYGGNVGIGTTSPNYKLHVNGTLGAGNTSVANLESEGYVSALSDIRKKEVVEYMDGLTIEQIAKAPIIKFLWKERPEDGLQVGSIAQYWEKVLPQSVHTTPKGFLSFAESRAALVGTISNSRELVKHEKRIAELERENRELKMKLDIVAQYGI